MIKRKHWYRKLITVLLLTSTLVSGAITLKPQARMDTPTRYTLSEECVVKNEQTASKGRILIIHTHTQEDYTDSNVVEMGQVL